LTIISFLVDVDLFISGLGLIDSRLVYIIGLGNLVKIDMDDINYTLVRTAAGRGEKTRFDVLCF
jgi:hypothetical protein